MTKRDPLTKKLDVSQSDCRLFYSGFGEGQVKKNGDI